MSRTSVQPPLERVTRTVREPAIDWPYPFVREPMFCVERVRVDAVTGGAGVPSEQYIATPNNLAAIQRVLAWAAWFIDDAKSKASGMDRTVAIDPGLVRTLDEPAHYQDSMLVTLCSFLVDPMTPTGRIPKYPLTLHFSAYQDREAMGDGTHGEIAYLADGRPGKMWFACWRNGRLCTVSCKVVDGEMAVTFVDAHDSQGNKTRIYDYRTA